VVATITTFDTVPGLLERLNVSYTRLHLRAQIYDFYYVITISTIEFFGAQILYLIRIWVQLNYTKLV